MFKFGKKRKIAYQIDDLYVYTKGLSKYTGFEIRVKTGYSDIDEYKDTLRYIVEYILELQANVLPNHTFEFYSWSFIFKKVNDELMEMWEITPDGMSEVEGVEYGVQVNHAQYFESLRWSKKIAPIYPRFSDTVVVSEGVYDKNLILEGLRYPIEKGRTGWWFISEKYNEDIETLKTIHLYHLLFKRPDLVRYLALPPGYNFYIVPKEGKIQISFVKHQLE